MSDFGLFLVEHFWPVLLIACLVGLGLGLWSGKNPNSFSRRLGRAGEAFWRVLREGDIRTPKQ